MTRWPIARATERSATKEYRCFMQKGFIPTFRAPREFTSNKTTFSMSQVFRNFMKMQETKWDIALA